MKSRLFTIATAISILFLAATLTLTVRGNFRQDYIDYVRNDLHLTIFNTRHGQIEIRYRQQAIDNPWNKGVHYSSDTRDDTVYSNSIFFHYLSSDKRSPSNWQLFSIPHWFLVLLFGFLPVRWFILQRRRRARERIGRCAKCGYDLRATKDRCPECGTAVVADSAGVSNNIQQ